MEEQADLDQAFDASDPDSLDRLMQCVKQASARSPDSAGSVGTR